MVAWLALDIETCDGRPEDAERTVRLTWTPADSWKDDTVGRRYREAVDAKKTKLALLDESPITAVAMRSPAGLVAVHQCPQEVWVTGATVVRTRDETELLIHLRDLLDCYVTDPDVTLVGHNLKFDLSKLRHSYVRHGVRQPRCLVAPHQSTFCTMAEFGKRFSVSKAGAMFSLDELLAEFSIPSHKHLVDGSGAAELFSKGEFQSLVTYALLDVDSEASLFLKMTGQSEELQ